MGLDQFVLLQENVCHTNSQEFGDPDCPRFGIPISQQYTTIVKGSLVEKLLSYCTEF